MEPAAMAAGVRATLASVCGLVVQEGKKLPGMVRGTTLQDVRSAKSKFQVVLGDDRQSSSPTAKMPAQPSALLLVYVYGGHTLTPRRGIHIYPLPPAVTEAVDHASAWVKHHWDWMACAAVLGVGVVLVVGVGGICWYFHHTPPPQPRRVVVSRRLPLRAKPNPEAAHGYDYTLDADAPPLRFARGLPRPVFVGALPAAAESSSASEELAADLLQRFGCSPVFLEPSPWPIIFTPSPGGGVTFNDDRYSAYFTANTRFADRVTELSNPGDRIFVYEEHLLALPGILREKSPRARIAVFFVDCPFPISEMLGAVTARDDLLRSLLDADVVGFDDQDSLRSFNGSASRHGRAPVVKLVGADDIGLSLDRSL